MPRASNGAFSLSTEPVLYTKGKNKKLPKPETPPAWLFHAYLSVSMILLKEIRECLKMNVSRSKAME